MNAFEQLPFRRRFSAREVWGEGVFDLIGAGSNGRAMGRAPRLTQRRATHFLHRMVAA